MNTFSSEIWTAVASYEPPNANYVALCRVVADYCSQNLFIHIFLNSKTCHSGPKSAHRLIKMYRRPPKSLDWSQARKYTVISRLECTTERSVMNYLFLMVTSDHNYFFCGRWSLFHKIIEGAVTPGACTAMPKGVHNSSMNARLQQEQPKIALEISFQHRQRLTLSWCSSSRVRYTGLQIKIYFDDFLFMLEVVPQH
ncbi:hypothetical protein EDD22DRAFT_229494 [Suillus occidentalis]|nr:hypothetical protein EDD22DRAFT_229494 [Suillus occidentalis]